MVCHCPASGKDNKACSRSETIGTNNQVSRPYYANEMCNGILPNSNEYTRIIWTPSRPSVQFLTASRIDTLRQWSRWDPGADPSRVTVTGSTRSWRDSESIVGLIIDNTTTLRWATRDGPSPGLLRRLYQHRTRHQALRIATGARRTSCWVREWS